MRVSALLSSSTFFSPLPSRLVLLLTTISSTSLSLISALSFSFSSSYLSFSLNSRAPIPSPPAPYSPPTCHHLLQRVFYTQLHIHSIVHPAFHLFRFPPARLIRLLPLSQFFRSSFPSAPSCTPRPAHIALGLLTRPLRLHTISSVSRRPFNVARVARAAGLGDP